jgi:hypothetical protein
MDFFSTNFMMGALDSLITPSQWLLQHFFPAIVQDPSEEIHFDIIDKTRRLAPFVSPVVAGKVVNAKGFTTKTFKPAYLKPKTPFDPNQPIKRAPGERMAGGLDPMTRLQFQVARVLGDHSDMIDRRMEVMASEALRTGKVTVTGDNYPTVVLDFGRAAGHTVVLTAGNRWGQAGIKPLANLETWAMTVFQASGVKPTDVVMDTAAFQLFTADADVRTLLNTWRINNNNMAFGGPLTVGATYMGFINGFNIWTYADWYIDPTDDVTELPMLPANTVILGSTLIEGARAYGAIRDEAAGYQAVPKFPKSWIENDPAVRFIMTQSAPLVVPTRVNASFCATVN